MFEKIFNKGEEEEPLYSLVIFCHLTNALYSAIIFIIRFLYMEEL